MLLTRALVVGACLALGALGARAQGVAPDPVAPAPAGDTVVGVRTSYYEQRDAGGRDGNPFLREDVVVVEPAILFSTKLGDDVKVSALFSHDYVSAASIDRLQNYPQQSGASGDTYFGLDLGLDVQVDDEVAVGGTIHAAGEADYASGGLSGRVSVAPAPATRVTLSLDVYHDYVRRTRFDGTTDGWKARDTDTLSVSVYRALTPWLHAEVGYSFSRQAGELETNFNAVVLEGGQPNPLLTDQFRGTEVREDVPDHRLRHAGEVRASVLVRRGTALDLGLAGYADSWGLSSFSVEPGVRHWLVEGALLVRVGYRYMRQHGTDYSRDHFRAPAPYHRTQDPDLDSFDLHSVGLKLVWHVAPGWAIDVAGDLGWRSDGLDQRWLGSGVRWEF